MNIHFSSVVINRISKRLLPVVESLCKDKDPYVRGSMMLRVPEVLIKLKDKERLISLIRNFNTENDQYLMGAVVGGLGKACTLISPKDPQANDLYKMAIPILKKLVKTAYVEGYVNVLTEFSAQMGQMSLIFSGDQKRFQSNDSNFVWINDK
jgi:hypothetical protein